MQVTWTLQLWHTMLTMCPLLLAAGMQSLVKRAAHKVDKRAREQQASHLGWQVNGRVLVPSLGMLVKFMVSLQAADC